MVLRIRFGGGRTFHRKQGKNRHIAAAAAALLVPLALMAYVLGFWRLASDMGFAGEFGISGVFAHWQIWIPMGALFQIVAGVLNRYGKGGELNVPRILPLSPFSPRMRKPAAVEDRKFSAR